MSAGLDVDRPVSCPVQDQVGTRKMGQDRSDVDLCVHSHEREHGSRTRTQAEVAGPGLAESRVARSARRPNLYANRATPIASDFFHERGLPLRRRTPSVVAGPQTPRVPADQDQRRRSLRVRPGEQDTQGRSFRDAQERRPFRAHGITHRAQIIHAGLESRELVLRDPIREPGAALVEEDQPGERCKPLKETSQRRLFPRRLQVGDPSRDPD
jgi:hypothetical protein